jgi:hypothetical protein
VTGVIYLHRSKTENLVYIGQTMRIEDRWDEHVLAAFIGSTTRFHQAIRRLGPSDFSVEHLACAGTREELHQLESYYIAHYDSTNPAKGYNMNLGGRSQPRTATEAIMPREVANERNIPLFSVYGEFIGKIRIEHALQMHGTFLTLRARGTGRRRHFTSAKLYARKAWRWEPRNSGGFTVMQLIRE